MDMGIQGKNALVFGASRGIGHGIARGLAAEGVNLLLVARSQERLAQHAAQIAAEFRVKVDYVALDLADAELASKVLKQAQQSLGEIDILVNISGGPKVGSAMDTESGEYLAQFQQMVAPFIDVTRSVARGMMQRQWGRIITVASSGVMQPIKDLTVSNTLRASLLNWNRTLAMELAPFGVTVNTLIPGRIHTERVDEVDQQRATRAGLDVAQVAQSSQAAIPMKRYGTVREFSSAAVFLASDAASYITGSCIRVDGGLVTSTF